MMYVKTYYRQYENGEPERTEFSDASLSQRNIVRGVNNCITHVEALVIVNAWNRQSALLDLPWRYWV